MRSRRVTEFYINALIKAVLEILHNSAKRIYGG